MAKADHAAPKKDEPVGVSNHTEKITSQVLEKVGKPPRLHRVEVCRHHDSNYRVNIWEQLEPKGDSALSMGVHILSSYYLKASDRRHFLKQSVLLDGQVIEVVQIDIKQLCERTMLVGLELWEQLAYESRIVRGLSSTDEHARQPS